MKKVILSVLVICLLLISSSNKLFAKGDILGEGFGWCGYTRTLTQDGVIYNKRIIINILISDGDLLEGNIITSDSEIKYSGFVSESGKEIEIMTENGDTIKITLPKKGGHVLYKKINKYEVSSGMLSKMAGSAGMINISE